MTSDDIRLSLGAYALGALEPAESAAVEDHLRDCPECAAELSELAGLPALLAQIDPDDMTDSVPSDDFYQRVLAAAERSPVPAEGTGSESAGSAAEGPGPVPEGGGRGARVRRITSARRFSTPVQHRILAAAAAIVVVAGVGIGVGVWRNGLPSHPGQTVSATAGRVHMTVTAASETSGTALTVSVKGLPENEHCHLVAIADDGSRHDAGSWVATYDGGAQVTGSTNVPRSDLSRLVLLGTQHQQLVSVSL